MRRLSIVILSVLLAFTACSEFDDSELWNSINKLDGRVAALEAWQKTVNSNISALQGLVDAIDTGDYITGVTEMTDGSGYIITFAQGNPLVVKHGSNGRNGADGAIGKSGENGKDGQDGVTAPLVGVRLHVDDQYYWTLDGEFIVADGKMMPVTGSKGADGSDGTSGKSAYELAVEGGYTGTLKQWLESLKGAAGRDGIDGAQGQNGKDGKDGKNGNDGIDGIDGVSGKSAYEIAVAGGFEGSETAWLKSLKGAKGDDAITPRVRIDWDTNYWEISTDGVNWMCTYVKATGPRGETGGNGDAVFAENGISQTYDLVTFKLANGESIVLPKTSGLEFSFKTLAWPTLNDNKDKLNVFKVVTGRGLYITYNYYGRLRCTGVTVISDTPDGWEVVHDDVLKRIFVKSPAPPAKLETIKILVLATAESGLTLSYWLTLTSIDDPEESQNILEGTYIPDAGFREALLTLGEVRGGVLTLAAAKRVTDIVAKGSNIKSLAGLEYFPNLLALHCMRTSVENITLPNLPNLRVFSSEENSNLTSIDLSRAPELRLVYHHFGDALSSLKVAGLTELEKLRISNAANLKSLNLTGLSSLEELICTQSGLQSLDLSDLSSLVLLDCAESKVSKLDLSNNKKLSVLGCQNTPITAVTGIESPVMESIDISYCAKIEEIDISKVPTLKKFNTYHSPPNFKRMYVWWEGGRDEMEKMYGADFNVSPSVQVIYKPQ